MRYTAARRVAIKAAVQRIKLQRERELAGAVLLRVTGLVVSFVWAVVF